MGVGACGDAGDPARRAVGRRRLGVEAHRRLDQAPRPAGPAVVQVRRQRPPRARGTRPDLDVEPGRAEPCEPAPCDPRVRVLERHHDAPDAGCDQRVGARRRATFVRARLEGDVGGAVPSPLPRRLERVGLGVGCPRASVPPLAGDRAVLVDDDTADPGIRRRGPTAVLALCHRPGDQVAVRGLHRRTSISGSLDRCRDLGRGDGAAGTPRAARRRTPSPIRTLTVGPGFSPGQPHGWRPWARGLPQATPCCLRSPPVGTCTQTPRALLCFRVLLDYGVNCNRVKV